MLLVVNLLSFVALWELVVRALQVRPYILPAPTTVARHLWDGLVQLPYEQGLGSAASYYAAILMTVQEALLGFVLGSLGGVVLSVAVTELSFLDRIVWPYIVGFQSLPKLALAPLFLIWFGHGLLPKVVMAAVLVFFPVLINTYSGLRGVDQDRVDLARSLGASRWQLLGSIKIHSALPFIFAGLRLGVVYSLLGAIVGEFVGGQEGLGVRIMMMQFQMSVAQMFSILLLLSAMGWLLDHVIAAVERRALFWYRRGV